jgi:HSP20 family molecular chaperone IbpA
LHAGTRFSDLLAIQQRLDRYAPGPTGWTPAVDILETSDQYIVIAEVPA